MIVKNRKIISILNKISIFLIFVNYVMISLNALSPIDLKIYYNNNKIPINIIYSFLIIYTFIYFIIWGYNYFKIKKSKKYYNLNK